jgi:hypothetical protein
VHHVQHPGNDTAEFPPFPGELNAFRAVTDEGRIELEIPGKPLEPPRDRIVFDHAGGIRDRPGIIPPGPRLA